MHVLGGLSLLILVAVSTMIRTGIGFEQGDGTAGQEEAQVDNVEVAAEAPLDPVAAPGSLHFGPMLDRMRP
jgi:hypothetical protein